jgi:hypothetical protein
VKDGVASAPYVPAIHAFPSSRTEDKDARHKPGMTKNGESGH